MPTGAEKAVLLLLSLEEEVARPIVSELSEGDLRKLRAVASAMHEVPAGAMEVTFSEFLDRSTKAVAVPRGGLRYLRKLSQSALGEERAREVFEESGVTSPFARLEAAPPDVVGTLLENETPQLAAAVLARLEPSAAARILATMPGTRQATVVRHVGRLTELPARVLEDVANALAGELPASDASTNVSVDGVARAAELLKQAGPASVAVLAELEADDAPLAALVRQAMFTFEDLRAIDARSMRELLRAIATDRLTIALKGASPEVSNAIFAGLSARAADMIRDDLALLGKVKKSEIEAARTEIVDAALRLESEGKLDLGRGGE